MFRSINHEPSDKNCFSFPIKKSQRFSQGFKQMSAVPPNVSSTATRATVTRVTATVMVMATRTRAMAMKMAVFGMTRALALAVAWAKLWFFGSKTWVQKNQEDGDPNNLIFWFVAWWVFWRWHQSLALQVLYFTSPWYYNDLPRCGALKINPRFCHVHFPGRTAWHGLRWFIANWKVYDILQYVDLSFFSYQSRSNHTATNGDVRW